MANTGNAVKQTEIDWLNGQHRERSETDRNGLVEWPTQGTQWNRQKWTGWMANTGHNA